MRTIRVTGKGKLKIRPDMTRITLSLEESCADYGETLRRSSEDAEKLRELLTAFGFVQTDLKTLNFHIDTEYEGYEDGNVWKQRFKGYRYSHTMKVEFPSDKERLGKILYALANSPVKPEFRLSYTIGDPEKAKNALLGKAVADAKEKAAALTAAAGVTLRDIQSIDYAMGEIDFEARPMNRMLLAKECTADAAESYDMDIEPDDMEATDTVTVVWEIV